MNTLCPCVSLFNSITYPMWLAKRCRFVGQRARYTHCQIVAAIDIDSIIIGNVYRLHYHPLLSDHLFGYVCIIAALEALNLFFSTNIFVPTSMTQGRFLNKRYKALWFASSLNASDNDCALIVHGRRWYFGVSWLVQINGRNAIYIKWFRFDMERNTIIAWWYHS